MMRVRSFTGRVMCSVGQINKNLYSPQMVELRNNNNNNNLKNNRQPPSVF